MPIFVDKREAAAGAPALHALIVGISAYRYLEGGPEAVADHWDMGQLTSTASSAFKMHEWLLKAAAEGRLPVPLATSRVLLSPAPAEAHLHGKADPATFSNLRKYANAWREDAKSDPNNFTLLYFAGHGVQRTKKDAVLCLEDFRNPNDPVLDLAAEFESIHGGMSPSDNRPNIARTQWYVVDTCRLQPEQLKEFEAPKARDVFDRELSGKDDRCCPTFYAAVSNHAAHAIPGGQTLFSKAIIDCLEGEAGDVITEDQFGEPVYGVTFGSMLRVLKSKVDVLNADFQGDQSYTTDGHIDPTRPICALKEAPTFDVSLFVDPEAAWDFGMIKVVDAHGQEAVAARPIVPHPVKHQLPYGHYTVELSFDPPHPPYLGRRSSRPAQRPRQTWRVSALP